MASGSWRPHWAWVIWADGGWPAVGQPVEPALHCSWPQVEDAISQTSQTLQLLIEHDPVSQRLDQLRLDARLSPHMQNARHSGTLSPLDTKENLEGTLRRRSLRCHFPPRLCAVSCPALGRGGAGSQRPAELGREPAGQGQAMRIVLTQFPPPRDHSS